MTRRKQTGTKAQPSRGLSQHALSGEHCCTDTWDTPTAPPVNGIHSFLFSVLVRSWRLPGELLDFIVRQKSSRVSENAMVEK